MLQITVPENEFFDNDSNQFIKTKEQILYLEHSLISISKWESFWKIPFLSSTKTDEQLRDYIRLMTITQNVSPYVYYSLTNENIKQIKDYIDDDMTATTFNEKNQKTNRSIITAEIIYYWMISLGIPFECQKWHLNKLLALIRVCNIKNQPAKKMNKNQILSRNHALNKQRQKMYNTKG